ncbi:uncharacterized protein PAN0_008d3460 [Moesziomyces antarcticus]|uniref:Uncharacterized protein n=2 Tax=Pseudozyma antarctica TaxID=84753 RepID=A0A081CEZ7_PSEA2|nr:uncharacterized protein PAN0_008d3460 [Moesziomyces antarcticus]GAK65243.1 hypothetical protein PAN0_008d3460 [Moesziomyces antarcticus]SPO46246.1 uncharacterized protein PSANT_03932 [Moesziomyces antarcticus]
MTFIDTVVPAAQWASQVLSIVSLIPVLVAVGARPRNAVYVSAESLTLLALSSLVWSFSLGPAQLYLALVVATLVLVYRHQRSIFIPLPLPSKGATEEDEVEKALTETPLRRFPYDAKLVVSNTVAAVVLSFFSSNESLATHAIHVVAGEPVGSTLAQAVEFQLTWLAAMLALHATMMQAFRVLMLYGFHPSKTPHQDPLHFTHTHNEKQSKPKLPAFVTAWIALSIARAAASAIVLTSSLIDDQQHISSHVGVFALTAMQPFMWAGVVVAIKIRNARTRNQTLSPSLSP